MPIDPRHDSDSSSTPTSPTRDLGPGLSESSANTREILKSLSSIGVLLEKQTSDILEVRNAQKEAAIKQNALYASHGEHRAELHKLGTQFVELKLEIGEVRSIAVRADSGQAEVRRKISDTQHELTGTLAAVQASQNGVAERAETVAKKQDALATETTQQTVTLSTIQKIGSDNAEAIASTTSMLARITKVQPIVNAVAIVIASALALAINAWTSIHK
jgi:chromosome segregation ATPase